MGNIQHDQAAGHSVRSTLRPDPDDFRARFIPGAQFKHLLDHFLNGEYPVKKVLEPQPVLHRQITRKGSAIHPATLHSHLTRA